MVWVPVGWSTRFSTIIEILVEDHARGGAVAVAIDGQEGPADEAHPEHGHRDQAPAVGEDAEPLIGHFTGLPVAVAVAWSRSWASTALKSTKVPSIWR